jgi:ABC-type branched-subunit amino acid transport system ATPase component
MTEGARLVVENMSVRYGGVAALEDVSLTAHAGQVTALIGPNGAGKSTMLAAISGLTKPVAGRVLVDGVDITGRRPQEIFRKNVVRTFQAPQLVSGLSVREHVVMAQRAAGGSNRLWRDLCGMGRAAGAGGAAAAADEVLDRMGLIAIGDSMVDSLPMGLRRLVEVAQAVSLRPSVLLLDEPSAGLDESETGDFAQAIADLCASEGMAILLVEHDLELVLRLSSHIVVIDFGRFVDSGSPDQIRSSKLVQDAYTGSGLE